VHARAARLRAFPGRSLRSPLPLRGPFRLGAALAFAVALALLLPQRGLDWEIAVGPGVVWVALVPWLWLVDDQRPWAAAWTSAAAAGVGWSAARAAWLLPAFAAFEPGSEGAGAATLGAAGAYFGVPDAAHLALQLASVAAVFGVAGAVLAVLRARSGPLARIVIVPAVWVGVETCLEVASGLGQLGFAAALAADGPALELAALGSTSALAFAAALCASLLVAARVRHALILVALLHVLGLSVRVYHQRIGANAATAAAASGAVRLGLVSLSSTDVGREERAQAYLERSDLLAASSDLDLIVWSGGLGPERAARLARTLAGRVQPRVPGRLDSSARSSDSPARIPEAPTPGESRLADRLSELSERAGLRWVLGWAPALGAGADSGAGRVVSFVGAGGEGTAAGSDPFVPAVVCYELFEPERSLERARAGARGLVATCDVEPVSIRGQAGEAGWTVASRSQQWRALAAVRAAESGLPVVLAAGSGATVMIDGGGWEQLRGDPAGSLSAATPLPAVRALAWDGRARHWVRWASGGALICIVGGCLGIGNRTNGRSRRDPRDQGRARDDPESDRRAAEASLTSRGSAND